VLAHLGVGDCTKYIASLQREVDLRRFRNYSGDRLCECEARLSPHLILNKLVNLLTSYACGNKRMFGYRARFLVII
jgi:hypothetical protein